MAGGRFDALDARRWARDHRLIDDSDVAAFSGDAAALPFEAIRPFAALMREGTCDECRVALGALRAMGCTVTRRADTGGYRVAGPATTYSVFRPNKPDARAPIPARLSLAELVADAPETPFRGGGISVGGRSVGAALALYGVYGLVAVGLAVGSSFTSGLESVVLAVVAGLAAAVTAWSVIFVGGITLVAKALLAHGRRSRN